MATKDEPAEVGNWPRDADDLVNGIPETTKAAKSLGHVPAAGNDPEAQLRVGKQLTGLGIEIPDGLAVQRTPVTPEDRRAAVQRQNDYAEEAADVLENAPGWNPVKHAAAVERGEDPAVAAREAAAAENETGDTAKRAAAERRAASDRPAADRTVTGRSAAPQTKTAADGGDSSKASAKQ